MKTITYIAAFFILLFFIGIFGSCKKGNVTIPFQEGEYSGQDILSSRNNTPWVNAVNITFKNGKFKSHLFGADSGIYWVKGDTLIHFISAIVVPPNVNSYDTFSDDFHITHQADSLILTKILQPGISTDQLRLKFKQSNGSN